MKHSQITTPQHPTLLSSAKQLQSLQQIFLHDKRLAWQVIDCQSSLYSETNTSMQKITYLTSLYMRIIQQLNTLQDPRQTYFSFKMQKLMHEPYIIRSFNNEIDHKKVALQNKKKQLQRKIEQEADRQNHYKVIEQAITAQEEKEKKINSKIKCIIDQSNLRLEERIKKRSEQRQNRFSPNRFSSNLSNKSNSPHKNHWADSHSNEFQLSIDQSDSIIKSIKRQLQEQQKLQSLHRKLNRTNTNPHSQKQL